MGAALLAHNIGRLQSARRDLTNISSSLATPAAKDIRQLDRLKAQKQAEALLNRLSGIPPGGRANFLSRGSLARQSEMDSANRDADDRL